MTATNTWWWCSFCDTSQPKGQQLVGVAIMRDPEKRPEWAALIEGRGMAIESACWEVDPTFGDPPEEWAEKLISDKARIVELELQWIGAGCITVGEWEAQQAKPP